MSPATGSCWCRRQPGRAVPGPPQVGRIFLPDSAADVGDFLDIGTVASRLAILVDNAVGDRPLVAAGYPVRGDLGRRACRQV